MPTTPSRNKRHRRRRDAKPAALVIAQGNCGRAPDTTGAFLQLCYTFRVDVVLVQEPWYGRQGYCKIQNHRYYTPYLPVDSWQGDDDRPRVMTYVLKNANLKARQFRPQQTRDLLWLRVNGVTILNVYRQPREPAETDTTQFLLDYSPPPNFVVAGDFNAKNIVWQPGVEGHLNGGKQIADWATAHRLHFTGEPGVPTHRDGNVLDLTFSNIPFTTSGLCDALHPGADHAAILTTIPTRGDVPPDQVRLRVPLDRIEAFGEIVEMGSGSLPSLPPDPNPDQLDDLAQKITDLMHNALEAVGKKPTNGDTGAPWWTECDSALKSLRDMQRIRGVLDCPVECHAFKATVRRAKRNYWQKIIDEVKNDQELYRVINWHKLQPNIRAPPLMVGEAVIEDTDDKAQALRRALLERFTAEDDLTDDPQDIPTVPQPPLPWNWSISKEELMKSTITKNTAPGVDGLSVKLLLWCWDYISEPLRQLFQGCLRVGHHPACFKIAEVVMLKKLGKKDYTETRSWRPIALLSCLSKGLEKLVARRIARVALIHGIISPQQAGALPKRSAADLVACLIHEIELALANKKTASHAGDHGRNRRLRRHAKKTPNTPNNPTRLAQSLNRLYHFFPH